MTGEVWASEDRQVILIRHPGRWEILTPFAVINLTDAQFTALCDARVRGRAVTDLEAMQVVISEAERVAALGWPDEELDESDIALIQVLPYLRHMEYRLKLEAEVVL